MYSHGMRQFYIDEIAQLESGEYVIPCNWIIRKKALTADCLDVMVSPVSIWYTILILSNCVKAGWQIGSVRHVVPATLFQWNFHDIIGHCGNIQWAGM
jgi:hypothetical protein